MASRISPGVRDGEDCWHPLENYLAAHTEVQFNHGICPDCFARAKEDLARRRPTQ